MPLGKIEYKGQQVNENQLSQQKTGVLLVNLGTPDAPTKPALRRYLKQFLSDPRVVEAPRLLWSLVLNGVILNTRPKKSAAAYETVWTDEGSPLLQISRQQEQKLRELLQEKFGGEVLVELGMCYGSPSIPSALDSLRRQGASQIVVLPMFPQYSGSTNGAVFDAVTNELQKWRWVPGISYVSTWHDNPSYIQVLANSISESLESNGKPEKLIFSFHGTPKSYLEKGDPYFYYCQKTALAVVDMLGLKEEDYQVCFQSRFGPEEWLQPYTDETLESLAKRGVKNVSVICPGFVADCLETIEEIGEENKEIFLGNGGEGYSYIPCVNDTDLFIQSMFETLEPFLPRS